MLNFGDNMMKMSLTLFQGILSQWGDQYKHYNMKEKGIDRMLSNTMRE